MPTLASCPLSASNSAESLPSGAARSRSASSTACFVLGMKKPWVEAEQDDDRDEAPADEEASHPVGAVGAEVDPGEQDQGHRRGVGGPVPEDDRPADHRDRLTALALGRRHVGAVGERRPEADHHRGDVEEDDDAVERDRCCDHAGNANGAGRRSRIRAQRASRSAAQSPLASDSPRRPGRRQVGGDDTVALGAQQPAEDHRAPAPRSPRPRSARRAGSGAARSGWPSRSSPPAAARSRRLTRSTATSTPLAAALAAAASTAAALVVAARDRVPAELRGGDREDARTRFPSRRAAPVARLAVGEGQQELEAAARRRVRAGAERPARDRRRRRCSAPVDVRLPGRPDDHPPAADDDRLVEVAPAVRPVVGDLGRLDLDEPVAGGRL